MTKSFSDTIQPPKLIVDIINNESLTPLRPFSDSISVYQETLSVVQPGTTIADYVFTKLNKIPWWKEARKLQKKGAPWEDILNAVKFSYAGKNPSIQITNKHKYWAKILQNGWPEIHGEPGEKFSYARENRAVLPVITEKGSVSAAYPAVIRRLLKTWGAKRITEGDIGVALEIYAHGGKLTKDQERILQVGWPHLVGPPGVPFKKYHPDADRLKNMSPAGTVPDYETIKKLQARGFFETRSRTKRNEILKDLGLYIKGYTISISKEVQEVLAGSNYGFSKAHIRKLIKLGKTTSSPEYTRYTDPDTLPQSGNQAFDDHHKIMVKLIGFIDLKKDNIAHEAFYGGALVPGKAPKMTPEKMPEKVPVVKKPSWLDKLLGKPVSEKKETELPKFSPEFRTRMARLEGTLSKKQRTKIEELKTANPEQGYTRFTYNKFPSGTDRWIMAYLFDFVDLDKDKNMHPAFIGGTKFAEVLARYQRTQMNYHPSVGYY